MVDAVNKKMKKAAVTEEDVCTLLQRYSASTVLSLLREVAQFPGVKIDWQLLVERTKTGIKTATECQMLWRHLAYRQPLIENVAAHDQLLDDDSDLECELEAWPPVSTEDAVEASNCVKMLASGLPNESVIPNISNNVDGGVHGNSSNVCSENLQVQKQSQIAGTCGEALDANGLSNNRKRRKWSEEEDQELITAVQKFGEGSWAAIIKGEFKGNRNATQLAQRWNIIRKKQGMLNIGGAKVAGPQLTEAQLATRRALDVALSTGCSTATNGTAGTTSAKTRTSKDMPVPKAATPVLQPESSLVTTSVKSTPLTSIEKVRPQKKAATQPSINTTDSIQAAAVAAGARIGSPSDAASLLKAVQSKNAVHIRGGGSSVNTSAAGSSNPLPPNVHFIRTGLNATSTSSASGVTSVGVGLQAKGNVIKPPAPSVDSSIVPKITPAAKQSENRALTPGIVQGSDAKMTTQVHEDDASLGECSLKAVIHKSETTISGANVGPIGQTPDVGNSQRAMDNNVVENEHKNDACKQVLENQVSKINDKSLGLQSCSQGVNGTSEVLLTAVDGNLETIEVTSEGLAET